MKPLQAIAIVAVVAVIVVGLGACDDNSRTATTPTPPPPPSVTQPSPPPPPFPAKSIQIGDVVAGQLQSSDPGCLDLLDPMDTWTDVFPCQEYRVSVPAAGTLSIHLTWNTPTGQMCIGTHISTSPSYVRHCRTTSPVDVSAGVSPGAYAFGVEFMGVAGTSKSYSLTTSLAAGPAAAGRRLEASR